MLSKLCCGLGNSLGLIGRERSIKKESEPLRANADLKGHEKLRNVRYRTAMIVMAISFDIIS